VIYFRARNGDILEFNVSRKVCEPFGSLYLDRVVVSDHNATVIGERKGELWFHLDGDSGASFWKTLNYTRISPLPNKDMQSLSCNDPSTLAHQLGHMCNNPMLSDFVVVVGKEEQMFYAHRVVLAARSDYFKAMFSWDEMKESVTSELRKPNTEPRYFKAILQYIYSGKISLHGVSIDDIFQILLLSDEFIIPSLIDTCQQRIASFIGVHNVYQILSYVSMLNGQTFKKIEESCLAFLIQYNFLDPAAVGKVSKEVLKMLLDRKILPNLTPVKIFKVIAGWKESNKTQDVSDLLAGIDYFKMDPKDIGTVVEPTKLLSKEALFDIYKEMALRQSKDYFLKIDTIDTHKNKIV